MLIGMWESVGKKSEQARCTDVVQRGNHQNGENLFGDDGLADRGDQVMDRNGAFAKKLFHHFVVAFGDHLDELFVRFLRFVGESGGNFFDRGLAVAIRLVYMGLHGH